MPTNPGRSLQTDDSTLVVRIDDGTFEVWWDADVETEPPEERVPFVGIRVEPRSADDAYLKIGLEEFEQVCLALQEAGVQAFKRRG